MSRERDRKRPRGARGTSAPAQPPRAGRPWLLPTIAAVFVLGALATWWFTQHAGPRPVIKDLEHSKRAANTAAQFLTQKRFREAQAAYREAVLYAPEDFWQLHFVLASTAAQISVENTLRAGISQPYSRSSVERVAAMREALAEFDRALQLADSPEARATIHANRAETFLTWGQMWEALRDFEAAARADTADPSRAQRAAHVRSLMSHPQDVLTLEEEMRRARAGSAPR